MSPAEVAVYSEVAAAIDMEVADKALCQALKVRPFCCQETDRQGHHREEHRQQGRQAAAAAACQRAVWLPACAGWPLALGGMLGPAAWMGRCGAIMGLLWTNQPGAKFHLLWRGCCCRSCALWPPAAIRAGSGCCLRASSLC